MVMGATVKSVERLQTLLEQERSASMKFFEAGQKPIFASEKALEQTQHALDASMTAMKQAREALKAARLALKQVHEAVGALLVEEVGLGVSFAGLQDDPLVVVKKRGPRAGVSTVSDQAVGGSLT